MQVLADNALLRDYVENDSQEAFATIVARHVNKVYSIALRQTRNPHQADIWAFLLWQLGVSSP
jgi:hypothetical protein